MFFNKSRYGRRFLLYHSVYCTSVLDTCALPSVKTLFGNQQISHTYKVSDLLDCFTIVGSISDCVERRKSWPVVHTA